MEGNSITSYKNLCRIFEMRIKLDNEKGVKTSHDVFSNYEKYSKKIDSFYNSEFQKDLKPLISPAVTLEKEENRLRRLIKLLEERLGRRIELEDRFYNTTGKYINGLQIIVSDAELEDKKERLSLISNYLETSREIDSVTDSLNKLKDSLDEEENKKVDYLSKNKIMEDELYSTFINLIRENNNYKNINEEDISSELDGIRSKVSEAEETLDITKESVRSLVTSGLEDDYTSYIEEAERNYYTYKSKEIILKIYKLVINFEDDFKLLCSKRDDISKLLEEKKKLRESLSIETIDDLLSFEKVLLLQLKVLEDEKEVLDNIANYTSRIKFKEERLEELNTLNSSAETLVILREYGLIEAYDVEDINIDIPDEDTEEEFDTELDAIELPELEESISEVVYDPYRIVDVKDYPKTLNVGLAKLKGESVREKVNKKLNPRQSFDFSDLLQDIKIDNNTNSTEEDVSDNNVSVDTEIVDENKETINNDILESTSDEIKVDSPVWEIPSEIEPKTINLENEISNSIPVWEIEPSFEESKSLDNIDISNIDITSSESEDNTNNNMFWIPVSDSKLETKDFPNLNIATNNNGNENFTFPTMNN